MLHAVSIYNRRLKNRYNQVRLFLPAVNRQRGRPGELIFIDSRRGPGPRRIVVIRTGDLIITNNKENHH